jgi:hypothetical protein
MYVWDKDPSGKYNAHNPLQLDKATEWIMKVKDYEKLRTIQIEAYSKKWDSYEINDTATFLNKGKYNNEEKVAYLSLRTVSKRIGVADTTLIKIIQDFDYLNLNRFYREEDYLAFKTQTYLNFSKGYFYFYNTKLTMNKGDTLDLRQLNNMDNFRDALFSRFLVTNKYNDNWVEWYEVK